MSLEVSGASDVITKSIALFLSLSHGQRRGKSLKTHNSMNVDYCNIQVLFLLKRLV